tara:strand:- start:1805 stop:3727 length:1923 start_codon:yes stop_codon:yes gene_type:complete
MNINATLTIALQLKEIIMVNTKTLDIDKQIQEQATFEKQLSSSNDNYTIAAGASFVRSMQDIGYRNCASAIAELIDNSIEASARDIAIEILAEDKSKVDRIIVMDNGCGMPPLLLRKAMTFGGTHRHGSSKLFGRYGFGLSTSTMSMGNSFTVITNNKADGKIYTITFDLDKCENGDYTDKNGLVQMPPAKELKKLPADIQKLVDKNFDSFESGTIVIVDKLNRSKMSHSSLNGLRAHLISELGVIFSRWIDNINVNICSTKIVPIDPLFQNPAAYLYDIGGSVADALEPQEYELKLDSGIKGKIRIHYSYLGFHFNKVGKKIDRYGVNPRHKIMKDWNGIIFSRNGRIIDSVTHIPVSAWENAPKDKVKRTFSNNDRYYSVLIDFDASLDSLFNVETTKQRIMPDGSVWTALYDQGMCFPIISKLVSRYNAEAAAEKQKKEDIDSSGVSTSEKAAEYASQFQNLVPADVSHIKDVGEENLLDKALVEVQKDSIEPTEENLKIAKENILKEARLLGKGYKISTVSIPGGNFFNVHIIGPTIKVDLNVEHRFYKDFYTSSSADNFIRRGLDLLLFSIAARVDLNNSNKSFYEREIREWSSFLNNGLEDLLKETSKKGIDVSSVQDEEDPSEFIDDASEKLA